MQKSKKQTCRYQPTKNFEGIKILNAESDYELFMNVSEVFEDILSQLEIKSKPKELYKKLTKIKILIERKISSFKRVNAVKTRIPKNVYAGQHLSESTSTLNSETDLYSQYDLSFEEFLNRINCPFCAEPQPDKINLIKHLDRRCTALMINVFEKKDQAPFSVFQILPNNTFKCNVCPDSVHQNIKHYFKHTKNHIHISTLRAAAIKKNFCEFLFCSCCKIQVPDNNTQISFHLNHEAHKTNAINQYKKRNLLEKGIICVYNKNKKFKCLVCNSAKNTHDTFQEIENHFKKPTHINNIKKGSPSTLIMYCEVCSKEVHFFKVNSHIFFSEHILNEKKYSYDSYQLCPFCGLKFDTLVELSQHVKLECTIMNDLKDSNITLESLAEKDLKKEKRQEETGTAENEDKENCIIVEDFENIPELLVYFKKFGQVEAVDMYNEKDVLIKFSQKRSFEEVLLFRKLHKIKGKTLQITTAENYLKKTEETTVENKNANSGMSDENVIITENYSDKNEDTGINCDTQSQDEDKLVKLFERAAKNLMDFRQSLDTGTVVKIAIAETLKIGQCEFTGFWASELSFPLESVSLHIQVNEIFEFTSIDVDLEFEDVYVFNNDALLKSYQKILSSDEWHNVELVKSHSYVPYIKCTHSPTNKPCTITFMESPKILSLMLSDCVKKNELVRAFCMLIRFWASVRRLKIKEFDYALISLLVFFLKNRKVVKNSFESYKKGTRATLLGEAVLAGEVASVQISSSEDSFKFSNVKELFREFLKFLLTFNFNKYAICLPLDYPVPRTHFTKNRSGEIFPVSLDLDKLEKSPMCVMDPFLFVNLASGIGKSDMTSFLEIVGDTIENK